MKTISINGHELALERRGRGEVTILVHGAVGDLRTWQAQMDALAAGHDLIAYSRRWHFPNSTHFNGTPYTVETHVADLLGLIAAIGAPVKLVGHSYGGAVCAVAALMRPDLVRCLVLAEASLFTLLLTRPEGLFALAQSGGAMSHVAPLVRQGKKEQALKAFLDVILGPGYFENLPPEVKGVMFDNLHTVEPMLNGMNAGGSFKAEHASQIRVPTLVLQGERSPAMFRITSEILAEKIPGVERVVLPGISHGLQLEAPEEFNRAVLKFLGKH
ncbi:MAG: alpha/beta hydrolase [Verrucomicrobia bacterium]|nr:MAG: alpha/beta hydrolase [Verrucomicrobiota bacterium]